ncbi:hypothetical protein Fot_35625 [Forsythia ovata]|uniref:Uncharacterized protein n=1 Tax=Forsythia ovata TaxID=205694 RepID=A0ABD1SM28_9LAMI
MGKKNLGLKIFNSPTPHPTSPKFGHFSLTPPPPPDFPQIAYALVPAERTPSTPPERAPVVPYLSLIATISPRLVATAPRGSRLRDCSGPSPARLFSLPRLLPVVLSSLSALVLAPTVEAHDFPKFVGARTRAERDDKTTGSSRGREKSRAGDGPEQSRSREPRGAVATSRGDIVAINER